MRQPEAKTVWNFLCIAVCDPQKFPYPNAKIITTNKNPFVNYAYKIAPNIVNLAVARPSMAVGRGTGGLSPPVPLQTTPTNPGEVSNRFSKPNLNGRIDRIDEVEASKNQMTFAQFGCYTSGHIFASH